MPLIQKPQQPPKKEQLRVRMAKEIYDEVKAYCSWAGIEFDFFVEEAALLVFDKDKDWKEQKKKLAEIKPESVTV